MEMYQVFTGVLSYSSLDSTKITKDRYREVIKRYGTDMTRALELWDGYIKTKNDVLFTMSLDALALAHSSMHELFMTCKDEMIEVISRRTTFLMSLASAVTGV